jgi:hypothetical protein
MVLQMEEAQEETKPFINDLIKNENYQKEKSMNMSGSIKKVR